MAVGAKSRISWGAALRGSLPATGGAEPCMVLTFSLRSLTLWPVNKGTLVSWRALCFAEQNNTEKDAHNGKLCFLLPVRSSGRCWGKKKEKRKGEKKKEKKTGRDGHRAGSESTANTDHGRRTWGCWGTACPRMVMVTVTAALAHGEGRTQLGAPTAAPVSSCPVSPLPSSNTAQI